MGSGETKLTVDGRDRHGDVRQNKLSDGHWHRVDIFTAGKVRSHYSQVSANFVACSLSSTRDPWSYL